MIKAYKEYDGMDSKVDKGLAGQMTEQVTGQVTEQVSKEFSFFQQLVQQIQSDLLPITIKVLFAIIVLIIGVIVIKALLKVINRWVETVAKKRDIDHVSFIEETIKFILYAILIVLVAEYFGVKTTSIVAVLGSAGLTVGLAFQGALSNFAGGLLLLIYRPFKIGDYIVVGNGETEGVISEIGIIYTTLMVGDFKKIVIPNGSISAKTIENLSVSGWRFLEMGFGISYDSDVVRAKAIIERLAENDPGVNENKEIFTYVAELSDSEVKIGLRAYVLQDDYIKVRFRLLEKAKVEFEKAGISIPFNQLDVHVVNQ